METPKFEKHVTEALNSHPFYHLIVTSHTIMVYNQGHHVTTFVARSTLTTVEDDASSLVAR